MAEYTGGWDANNPLSWQKSYVYAGSRLLCTYTKNQQGAEDQQFHHPDRLGTRLVTNNQANTSFEQNTLPFGTPLNGESTGSTNQRFTSYDRNTVANLDYAVNRSYSTAQGRFTTVDPIGMSAVSFGNPQSLNLYAYVENNPVDFTDPSGLFRIYHCRRFGFDLGEGNIIWTDWSCELIYDDGNAPIAQPVRNPLGNDFPSIGDLLGYVQKKFEKPDCKDYVNKLLATLEQKYGKAYRNEKGEFDITAAFNRIAAFNIDYTGKELNNDPVNRATAGMKDGKRVINYKPKASPSYPALEYYGAATFQELIAHHSREKDRYYDGELDRATERIIGKDAAKQFKKDYKKQYGNYRDGALGHYMIGMMCK